MLSCLESFDAGSTMYMGMRGKSVVSRRCGFGAGGGERKAFTLVELLVSISVVSFVAAILLPVLSAARRRARFVICANNQRWIVQAANLFAADNDGFYPESVATLGTIKDFWNWQEPMMLVGYTARSPRMHRSVSAYLRAYISNANVLYCPGAPGRYKYLRQAWDAGDEWDNPETPVGTDPLSGTYCLYWSYVGRLQGRNHFFYGPQSSTASPSQSRLLVTDYFGYDHYRSPRAYGSSERFSGASVTEGTLLSSPYWSGRSGAAAPEINLHAGYIDGRVETWRASDSVAMKVIVDPKTGEPYRPGIGPGEFYLPENALR